MAVAFGPFPFIMCKYSFVLGFRFGFILGRLMIFDSDFCRELLNFLLLKLIVLDGYSDCVDFDLGVNILYNNP